MCSQVFAPLFFASIGYSCVAFFVLLLDTRSTIADLVEPSRIPFLDLFTAKRFWQGLVFSIFMTLGKLLVGIWIPIFEIRLRRFPKVPPQELSTDGHRESVSGKDLATAGVDAVKEKSARCVVMWPSRTSIAPAIMLGVAMVARGEIGLVCFT